MALALLAVCLLVGAFVGSAVLRYRAMLAHVAVIEWLGGNVNMRSAAPHWLVRLLPDEMVFGGSPSATPNWIRRYLPIPSLLRFLEYFDSVEAVWLDNGSGQQVVSNFSGEQSDNGPVIVSDDVLAHVAAFSDLESLYLRDTDVSDAGLIHLQHLRRLQYLNLGFTRVTDDGMAILAGLPLLEGVGLANTEIGDAGVAKLAQSRSLRSVNLRGTRVTDVGLRLLRATGQIEAHVDNLEDLFWKSY